MWPTCEPDAFPAPSTRIRCRSTSSSCSTLNLPPPRSMKTTNLLSVLLCVSCVTPAGGVMRYLEERRVGFEFGRSHVPIVPAAALFDLPVGDGTIRPNADCGYQAARTASAAPVLEGSIGAGAGATIGKASGMERAM